MKILKPDVSLPQFLSSLSEAKTRLLLLDYDGTLAPFRQSREQAVPYPGVRERLTTLIDSGTTRVIIISGRAVDDLQTLLGLEPMPEAWGCHGAENLLPDGSYHLTRLGRRSEAGLRSIDEWAEAENLTDVLEKKPAGRAFHWRGLSELRQNEIVEKIKIRWKDEAAKYGFVLHQFDGGLELKDSSITKGTAVSTILEDLERDAAIAYLGDDATDENAFAALGDRGLKVLVRPEDRQTAADLRLEPPDELLEFLDLWLTATGSTDHLSL